MSPAQDAGDRARLLEAPSLLVLVAVLVSPWLRRLRWEACVALRAILMRLIPLGPLTRLVLPAVLTRPVTPLLAWATVIPAFATTSSSSAVAPVVALGASTEVSFSNGSELLTVAAVVAMQVMEGAEWSAVLG